KQIKLNSLENKNNEIRAIFAVNMLNEGWDVLNLFDIVRLYDTRDGTTKRDGTYIPGSTTLSEAQLIGRGARYFPFVFDDYDELYKRKFDNDIQNELRIIETLHYHCKHNPKYIYEIKQTLTQIGIISEKEIQYDLFVKKEITKKEIWKKGLIFLNEKQERKNTEFFGFSDINLEKKYSYEFPTGKITESKLFSDQMDEISSSIKIIEKEIDLKDFGKNVIRFAKDKLEVFQFTNLKKYFPNIRSREQFIEDKNYLGGVKVFVKGPDFVMNNLEQTKKFETVFTV
ncbi:MAG: type III deoxyribonuclease, partial [Ignavibacteria bacterium]